MKRDDWHGDACYEDVGIVSGRYRTMEVTVVNTAVFDSEPAWATLWVG